MIKKQIKRKYRISKHFVYKETVIKYKEIFWTFLGTFLGIGMIAFIQSIFITKNDNLFLIGSFGASSVLIYGVIQSPLAQTRNLIGGHIVSAIVGATVCRFLPDIIWLTAALAILFLVINKEPMHRRFEA
jgi:CBS domain-containing membrane protein